MAEIYGWVGKILFVDLTSGTIEIRSTTDYVPKWIGGRALAAKLYWDEVPPDCGGLDPENRLIFASGPAGGTLGAGSSRTAIVSKSAFTIPNAYMQSTPGGDWAAELKYAGFDAVVVRGKAPEPVYIWIHDGEVEIKKAARLWGMTTGETESEIRRLWGDQTRTMLIGPAGENLCLSSVIMTDVAHATGGVSLGSVMGSKNLKAIAVRGTGGVRVKRPQDLIDFYDTHVKIGGMYGGPYSTSNDAYEAGLGHGTGTGLWKQTESIEERFSKTSYWRQGYLAWEEIQAGTIRMKNAGCLACPVCCTKCYLPVDPTGKEEFNANLSAGFAAGQCGEQGAAGNWEKALFGKVLGRSAMLGMSTYQELGASAYIMGKSWNWFKAAVKAGLLTKETCGLDIPTDPEAQAAYFSSEEFVGKNGVFYLYTYKKNDFFKQLAEEGWQRFLLNKAKESPGWKEIFDGYVNKLYYVQSHLELEEPFESLYEALQYRHQPNSPAEHVVTPIKTISGFMPNSHETIFQAQKVFRAKFAPIFGLGPKWFDVPLAEKPVPERGEVPTYEDKVPAEILMEHWRMEADSLMYCGWAGFPRWFSVHTPDYQGDPTEGSRLQAAILGIDYAPEQGIEAQREGLKTMEAPCNLERAIRVREGLRKEHDMLTDGFFEANKDWVTKEVYSKVISDYYTARGWDADTGIPTRTKLEELGMKDVADDLEQKYGVTVPA